VDGTVGEVGVGIRFARNRMRFLNGSALQLPSPRVRGEGPHGKMENPNAAG
jgi:hypothetical protein